MKFTKVHWFYETEVNGVVISVQRKTETSKVWEASGARGLISKGKTRKEAVENYLKDNEGRI